MVTAIPDVARLNAGKKLQLKQHFTTISKDDGFYYIGNRMLGKMDIKQFIYYAQEFEQYTIQNNVKFLYSEAPGKIITIMGYMRNEQKRRNKACAEFLLSSKPDEFIDEIYYMEYY
mgnify:FL=1